MSNQDTPAPVEAQQRQMAWRPIETAPKMQTILLFAVTDVAEDGTVRNWRKETGSWMTGYDTDDCRARNLTSWRWGGEQLKTYQVQPTHWMPLPASPPSETPTQETGR